jgi:glycerol-3-phosphate dehydrogenase
VKNVIAMRGRVWRGDGVGDNAHDVITRSLAGSPRLGVAMVAIVDVRGWRGWAT